MTRRILTWTATGLLGLLGSASALALESGFYVGAMGAQATADVDRDDVIGGGDLTLINFSPSIDDSDTALGLVVGWQFVRWVALEAQIIDLGEYSAEVSFTDPNVFASAPHNIDVRYHESVEAAAVTLSGIFTIPIGEQVAIGLRGGFAVSAAETSYSLVARRGNNILFEEEDDDDAEASDLTATFGIGVEWDPTRHFGMRLEWQRINDVGSEDDDYDGEDFDDEEEHSGNDVDLISLSLIGRF